MKKVMAGGAVLRVQPRTPLQPKVEPTKKSSAKQKSESAKRYPRCFDQPMHANYTGVSAERSFFNGASE
jgi:hypothetical protein